jgi:hypothetical protein
VLLRAPLTATADVEVALIGADVDTLSLEDRRFILRLVREKIVGPEARAGRRTVKSILRGGEPLDDLPLGDDAR